ncbi:MAG: LacI family DNA-binding transcriptional regulator [Spirochaetia bacterium]
MKVTINDIARITNVSKSTISRVINESGPVALETRRKVRDAIEALNYEPNEVARSLSLKRTRTVGVIVQDIRNPYYAYACWHAERFFRKYDYKIIISNADNDPGVEESVLNAMKYRGVEGVLCVGVQEGTSSLINFMTRSEVPLVLVDREIKGYDVARVILDNVYGGQLVADYLFSLGHTRIAFLTSSFTEAERLRLDGFLQAFANRNLDIAEKYIISQTEEMWHRGECPELIKLLRNGNPPTAIFASNDYKAFQLLNILKKSNIHVPEDISLVGYDDVEAASYVSPALTTVHQPIDKMIDLGAQMLMRYINGDSINEKEKVMKPWLVERESTRKNM